MWWKYVVKHNLWYEAESIICSTNMFNINRSADFCLFVKYSEDNNQMIYNQVLYTNINCWAKRLLSLFWLWFYRRVAFIKFVRCHLNKISYLESKGTPKIKRLAVFRLKVLPKYKHSLNLQLWLIASMP